MAMTEQKLRDLMINPYGAINLSSDTSLNGGITKKQWINQSVTQIKKRGQTQWLFLLLRALEGKELLDTDEIIPPQRVVVIHEALLTQHPFVLKKGEWVEVNLHMFENMGVRDWLKRLLIVLETGGVWAEDIKRVLPEDLPEHIQHIIEVCEDVIKAIPQDSLPAPLETVLRGCLKRNRLRLKAIYKLSDDPELGNSALQIARNMLEDLTHIEYLTTLDPDNEVKKLKQFFEFQWVQLKMDMDSYRKTAEHEGLPNSLFEVASGENIENNYERVIKLYEGFRPRKDGSLPYAWSRIQVEGMINRMQNQGSLPADKAEMMAFAYIEGSRSTHFNPLDVISHFREDSLEGHLLFAQITGGLSLLYQCQIYLEQTIPDANGSGFSNLLQSVKSLLEILKVASKTVSESEYTATRLYGYEAP